MIAVCLVVAGVVRATLPGPEFTLAWEHSVEKTRWEERYRVEGARLKLIEARVEGNGAGMETPQGARLRDGRWSWHPETSHADLLLTRSPYARDYLLCSAGHCASLGDWIGGDADLVNVRPCELSAGRQ